MKNKSVIITGGAGFIGSHAVDHFLDKGYEVYVADSFTYAANKQNLFDAKTNKRFTLRYFDICNFNDMSELCRESNAEWIINFAAETHVDNSIKSTTEFIRTNILGVLNLLDICRTYKKKLLHISTDEVYGSCLEGFFNEADTLNPTNPYSATKAAAEHFIRAFANTYDVEYLIVRPSNNFGPRQHIEKFIPTILDSIHNNKQVPIYGDGTNVRDWLYVKDCVKIIEMILLSGLVNETFNITTNNHFTNKELVKKILNELKKDFHSHTTFIKDRLGHDFRYAISNKKLLKYNINVESDFEYNLKNTIAWYIKQ
ncbi:dTDP-glucose 4,6-dehydratase [Candidatus Pacearchaeota archaeon]|nr:dTDP-glucose 4,6-dehydratase [Candidatus Pacearchaeota archaeon]|tara:strand:- start:145 stop:1083 length:939 start_codon:yes stop_codon:yes gene_type:complete